ncbi:MAG TPA: hypothetical protein VEK57_22240 [Thermoanaerobaculia bacterium]|nr:hypothetical protein [Thermoanaerobaculia bacterium]
MRNALLLLLALTAGCRTASAPHPADALWSALRPLCGQAFEGKLVEGTEPSDAEIGKQRLVMHVRQCSDDEIRIPFQVGENRSRTWVLTRTPDGVRLKHDHRHEDGTEDRITQYGGDTRVTAASRSLDFYADAYTANLIPTAAPNIWTVAVDERGRTFTYALRRETQGRRFRVEFDLTTPVATPPDPW